MTLINGDFSNSTNNWYFWANDTSKGDFKVINKEAVIDVADPGKYPWSLGLLHDNIILQQGIEYRISFTAKASTPGDIIVRAMKNAPPYMTSYTTVNGVDPIFHLTTEKRKYEFAFMMDHPTDLNAAVNFLFGGLSGSVVIDDVKIDQVNVDNEAIRKHETSLRSSIPIKTAYIGEGKKTASRVVFNGLQHSTLFNHFLMDWFICNGFIGGLPETSNIYLKKGTARIAGTGDSVALMFDMGFGFYMAEGTIKGADLLRFTMNGTVKCKNNRGRLKVTILHGDVINRMNNIDRAIVWAEQRRGNYKKDSIPVRLFTNDGSEIYGEDGRSYGGYFFPLNTPVTVEVDLRGFDLSNANKMTVKLIAEDCMWDLKVGNMEFIKRSGE